MKTEYVCIKHPRVAKSSFPAVVNVALVCVLRGARVRGVEGMGGGWSYLLEELLGLKYRLLLFPK